jgi:hypothetical protein
MPERRVVLWRALSCAQTSEVPFALLAPGKGFSLATPFGTAFAIVTNRSGSSSLIADGAVVRPPEVPLPLLVPFAVWLLFAATEPSSESVAGPGAAAAGAADLPEGGRDWEWRPGPPPTGPERGSEATGETEGPGLMGAAVSTAPAAGGIERVRASWKICWIGLLGFAPLSANCMHPAHSALQGEDQPKACQ